MKYLILGETFPFGKGRYRGIYPESCSLHLLPERSFTPADRKEQNGTDGERQQIQ
jgi:hypothetical protein